jgi:hypothetical protein
VTSLVKPGTKPSPPRTKQRITNLGMLLRMETVRRTRATRTGATKVARRIRRGRRKSRECLVRGASGPLSGR